jgi:hypothetical protein
LLEIAAVGETVVVVVEIQNEAETDLAEVGETTCLAGFLFGAREGGKEKTGENRDDGDDYEQFDERKGSKGAKFGGAVHFVEGVSVKANGGVSNGGKNLALGRIIRLDAPR